MFLQVWSRLIITGSGKLSQFRSFIDDTISSCGLMFWNHENTWTQNNSVIFDVNILLCRIVDHGQNLAVE